MIAEGRVEVNGEVAVLGRRVDPAVDRVSVDGVPIATAPGLVYYLLNKPAGVVSTASDPQGRPTVVGLVPSEPRVYPVGRLDAATEGLLLLTNDGELAHRLTHPSFGVEKEYLAHVEGDPKPAVIRRLRDGVELDDGATAPAKVTAAGPGPADGRRGGSSGHTAGANPDRASACREPAPGPLAGADPGRGEGPRTGRGGVQ
jgi:23S rRNA pseudouridine2605 synthase